MYIDQCTSNERTRLAWLKLGIWELTGKRGGAVIVRCPFVTKIKCGSYSTKINKTQRWQNNF